MTEQFRPMLAGRFVESKLRFPIICQPKLDGIRASVVNGKLVTRTLKPVPNAYTRSLFERPEYEGFDGELIVGEPTAYDCYRKTCSGVMSEAGTPSVTYYLFDVWNKQTPYALRWLALGAAAKAASPHSGRGPSPLHILTYSTVFDMEGLLNLEADWVGKGYEGVILRDPNTLYKFGRGSATKQELLKLKRYIDFEAEIIGVEEEQHNANEAKTNALGRTERSSAKAGKVGKGTMGKLRVRRLSTGVEFSVGTGFSAAERQWFWDRRGYSEAGGVVGKIVKIKSFPIGVKDLPRHPVFLGFRDKRDM